MASTAFPLPIAGELDMGNRTPQPRPQPQEVKQPPRSGLLGALKLLGEAAAGIGVLVLLWSITQQLAGYRYEVAKLNETQSKILQIYERREDAGRAAIQAEIDRIELDLKNPKPAERRKANQLQLQSLKKRLETSLTNSKQFAGGDTYPPN